jgi:hypothetical protein
MGLILKYRARVPWAGPWEADGARSATVVAAAWCVVAAKGGCCDAAVRALPCIGANRWWWAPQGRQPCRRVFGGAANGRRIRFFL